LEYRQIYRNATDMIKTPIVQLILGGARSGKSSFAEKQAEELAKASDADLLYIATGQAFDAEMTNRIARHQADRAAIWTTLEEPLELPKALEAKMTKDQVILVDCVTLWLSNLMLSKRNVEQEAQTLVDVLETAKGHVIFVSNEVGQGIVPDNALARRFRDEAGWLNQKLAAVADEVVFITAGLPQWLKHL
jgi:adenosylcobinamide kinase/adenosylcobinamide-phosphate guanylyltransferase